MNEQLLSVKCCRVYFGEQCNCLKQAILCTSCFHVLHVCLCEVLSVLQFVQQGTKLVLLGNDCNKFMYDAGVPFVLWCSKVTAD